MADLLIYGGVVCYIALGLWLILSGPEPNPGPSAPDLLSQIIYLVTHTLVLILWLPISIVFVISLLLQKIED